MTQITHVIFSFDLNNTMQHLYQISIQDLKPDNTIVVVLWKDRKSIQFQEDFLSLWKEIKSLHDFTISVCMTGKTNTFVAAFRLIQSLFKATLIKGDLFSFSVDYVYLNIEYFKRLWGACFNGLINTKEGVIYPVVVDQLTKLNNLDPISRIRNASFAFDEIFALFGATLTKIVIPNYIKYNKFGDALFYLVDSGIRYKMNNYVYFPFKKRDFNLRTLWESLHFWYHRYIEDGIYNVYNV